MSYEDTLIREMTDERPPNHEDACPVCDKIECVCPPEDAPTEQEIQDRGWRLQRLPSGDAL